VGFPFSLRPPTEIILEDLIVLGYSIISPLKPVLLASTATFFNYLFGSVDLLSRSFPTLVFFSTALLGAYNFIVGGAIFIVGKIPFIKFGYFMKSCSICGVVCFPRWLQYDRFWDFPINFFMFLNRLT